MFIFFNFRALCLLMAFVIIISCTNDGTFNEGKLLYNTHCSGCHGKNGEGLEALIPPLSKADMLLNGGATVSCWIRNGLEGKIVVNSVEFENSMPANPRLSAIEITNILNYINNSWGNHRDFITLEDVNNSLKKCN